MPRDINYEINNIGYDEQYPEGGIKCKNYELCEGVLPDWWFDCKGHYLCTNCHMMFGTWGDQTGKGELEVRDDLECPICLNIRRSISQPNCDHFTCIPCFKRCYYGEDFEYPQFPYPEIQDEYEEDQTNPKWYPLIQIYDRVWDAVDQKKWAQMEEEENLRRCPMCRR